MPNILSTRIFSSNEQDQSASSITGTGTLNHLTKWSGATSLGDASLTDDGINISILDGVFLSSQNTLIQQDFGSGAYYQISSDAGAEGESYLFISPTTAYLQGGSVASNARNSLTINDTDAKLIWKGATNTERSLTLELGDVSLYNQAIVASIFISDNATALSRYIGIATAATTIKHGTQLTFDSPIYNYAQLSASTVPYLNASKNLVSSTTTPTELGYVHGVTSAIQTQIDTKAPSTSPTLTAIVLAAGAAGAGLAPLKFTSGTNLTTPENGTIEYNGTNFFATRTGAVRENLLVAVDNASAPATNNIGVLLDYYGTSSTRALTTPNRWMSVNIAGSVYKIPLYS